MKALLSKLSSNKTSSLVTILLGLILTLIPGESIKLLTILIGVVISGYGVYLVFNYFVNNSNNTFGIIIAFLSFIIGMSLIVNSIALVDIAVTIIGFVMLFKGITKLYLNSVIHDNFNFIISIIEIATGFLMLINPFGSAAIFLRIIGIVILVSSILELFNCNKLDFDKKDKNKKKTSKVDKKNKIKNNNNKEATELEFVEKKER